MGRFIKLEDKKRKENPFIGDVRTVDPSPVWVGFRKDTSIKRYMPPEKAEEWSKKSPDNLLRLKLKKYELDEL